MQEITVDYQEEVEKESTDDENEAENGDEEGLRGIWG